MLNNNIELEKKPIWAKVILIAVGVYAFYWILMNLIFSFLRYGIFSPFIEGGGIIDALYYIVKGLIAGQWWILVQLFLWTEYTPIFALIGLLSLIILIIGFNFGLRKRGKFLFIPPITFFILFSIIGLLFGWPPKGEMGEWLLWILIQFVINALFIFFCLSLIITLFFRFKKEHLLLKIAVVIFIIILSLPTVSGAYLSNKLVSERKSFENKLGSLRDKAIQTGDSTLCEEINILIEEESKEILGVEDVLDYSDYYRGCTRKIEEDMEEIAIKNRDDSLCEKLEGGLVDGCRRKITAIKTGDLDACYNLGASYIVFPDTPECVAWFASEKNDPSLCETGGHWLYYGDRIACYIKYTLIKNNPEICDMMFNRALNNKGWVSYDWKKNYEEDLNSLTQSYNRCITELSVDTSNAVLCNKLKEITGEEMSVTINKCLEEVKSR